jgi:hypothetical protein
MSGPCRASLLLVCLLGGFVATPVLAAGPRNPYSSFNLSGVNYGAQQWERAQREGRRVWPYYNQPQRTASRSTFPARFPPVRPQ